LCARGVTRARTCACFSIVRRLEEAHLGDHGAARALLRGQWRALGVRVAIKHVVCQRPLPIHCPWPAVRPRVAVSLHCSKEFPKDAFRSFQADCSNKNTFTEFSFRKPLCHERMTTHLVTSQFVFRIPKYSPSHAQTIPEMLALHALRS